MPATNIQERLLIANIVAQIAFGLLAMTICLPSMQEWGDVFDADQAAVQLTFSGYVLAYGVLQLVYGPLSDRYGRKAVLMVGLAVACAGSLLAALAADLPSLVAARILQGVGSAAGMVVGRASVQDLFRGPEKTRVMAYVGMVLGLCPPLATIVGGQVHVLVGWQGNFVLIAALAATLMLAAWRGMPAHPARETAHTHWLRDMLAGYGVLVRHRAFLLNVTILATSTAAFYAFLSGAPIVLRSYGVGPEGVGWYIMSVPVSYIAGNYLTSSLVHRAGRRWMMGFGQLLTLGGLALMLVLDLTDVKTPLAFSLPLLLFGIGHGFLMPACLAATVGLVPALAGSAAGIAGLMQQLLGASGGYAVGWFAHEGSMNLGLLMTGFTLCASVALVMLRRRQ